MEVSWSKEAPNFIEFSAGQKGAEDTKRKYELFHANTLSTGVLISP